MIVTIDGPAGAGKSTVARGLAVRLGYLFLDTGAMYRAVTYAVMHGGADLKNIASRLAVAERISIELKEDLVLIDGEDVTALIRAAEVTENIHYMADDPSVRALLVERQRAIVRGRNVVTEGRDQGTVVFPDAECKFFLTASADERARRRQAERSVAGEAVSLDEIRTAQDMRDRRDASRPVGALRKAEDALEVVTDGMTSTEVVTHLEALVFQKAKEPNS